ncbi:tetratricopeptide repeat protein, partial [Actinomyces viscosus]
MKERAALWCQRAHEPWSEPEWLLTSWLSRHLPVPGVLFLDLWDDEVRRSVLYALNEMRIRLARPGSGCVIVCGPFALLGDASHEAADLWSIRSLTCVIGSSSRELVDRPQRREEDDSSSSVGANDGSRHRSTWSITVPSDRRTPELAITIRETDRARRLLPTEPWRAREVLDALPEDPSPLASAFRGLTGAEIGGLLDDAVTVEVNLKAVLETLADFPAPLRSQVADAVLDIAMTFGAVDVAEPAARELERLARGLEESLGTPEAHRYLSVALDNKGDVARARGDWNAAEAAYQESLGLARGLEKELGTPESRRDLSIALNSVGRVAETRGDWDAAETAYQESLKIRRDLAESLATPETQRNL